MTGDPLAGLAARRSALPVVAALLLLLPSGAASATEIRPAAPEDGSVVSMVLGTRTPAERAVGDRERTAVWGWPLAGRPDVARGFDPPERRWLAGHRGIDLVGVAGEAVLAVDTGVVAWSGTIAGVGIVSVDHAGGLRSTYQPVTDRVGRGERVARGQRLGRLDAGGHCVVADCLHLGARRGADRYVDPTPLLQPAELSLLPVTSGRGHP
ncbi:M23 family metallopeptidase [Ornithinimicrobium pekingense]|uniref:M23ase beta-sheet core domain-containing protein n=1 Tax=Ornithinimicrobium pekingense TaxID=384677 RepID=A0ABQ2F5R9_9MICO|nr:M23 family metallopeptidase [Ornithinimicrobium pekingense]GGK62514.1 hypothetical protein GCM10011509_08600 [Ornithinimicrobium pekingense]